MGPAGRKGSFENLEPRGIQLNTVQGSCCCCSRRSNCRRGRWTESSCRQGISWRYRGYVLQWHWTSLALLILLWHFSNAQTLHKSQLLPIAEMSNIGNYGWQPGYPCVMIDPGSVACDKSGFVTSLNLRPTLGAYLPESIRALTRLSSLTISSCRFSGSLPASLGNLKALQRLKLDGNLFEGPIPNSLSLLTNLALLNLSHNLFTGPVPAGLQKLPKLSQIDISDNYLTGVVSFKAPPCAQVKADKNCMAKGSACTTKAAQRTAVQCKAACGASVWQAAAVPACSGHGTCYPNGTVTLGTVPFWACKCDSSFSNIPKGSFVCKQK